MRSPKIIVGILIVASLSLAVYFATRPSNRELEQTGVSAAILGHAAQYKNEGFLKKKLSEIDFEEKNNVTQLTFILSEEPQQVEVAKRALDNGEVVTSLSYTFERLSDGTAKYTLYVNPQIYPPSDPAELERQYSQLALIAAYQTTTDDTAPSQQNLQTFLSEYRENMDQNTIFTISK